MRLCTALVRPSVEARLAHMDTAGLCRPHGRRWPLLLWKHLLSLDLDLACIAAHMPRPPLMACSASAFRLLWPLQVLVRMEGLVNDLVGLLDSSSARPAPATSKPFPTSPAAAAAVPKVPDTPDGRLGRKPQLDRAAAPRAGGPSGVGAPGSVWNAPAGSDEAVEAAEEQPSLAASVVALQVGAGAGVRSGALHPHRRLPICRKPCS